jgi:exopolyphosphatase / guanosine-5'-triphosphate,3'-diphosphate pyrophosphatase
VRTVAALDIGSNATRLLISQDGRPLVRRSLITRLAEGLNHDGALSAAAIDRTVAALAEHREAIGRHDATAVRAVATGAARRATNAEDLERAVAAALGVRAEVLSAEDEARLTYQGAVGGLPEADGRRLVTDIGGASTELVIGTAEPEAITSIDLGSATLTEAELPSDPPRPEELSNAVALVLDAVDGALRVLPDADDSPTLIGVGGTVVTVAAVELGLALTDSGGQEDEAHPVLHGFYLTRAAAEDVFRTLAGEPLVDRVHNPGLPRARAPVIVGGCCLLVGLLRRLHAPGMLVALTDLLDGVAAELR